MSDPRPEDTSPHSEAGREKAEAENSRKADAEKSDWFAFANLAATGVSFGVAVFTALVSIMVSWLTNRTGFVFDLPRIHWMAIVVVLNTLYVLASYITAVYRNKSGILAFIFRIPSWVELRNFGEQRVAKISYVALVAIPIGSYFVVENPLGTGMFEGVVLPLNIKISFFVAFFFSLALIMFAVGCPKEFHRKPAFEGVKTVNLVLTSVERTTVNVEGKQDFYDSTLDASRLELRSACWLFYTLGLVLSVIILIRSALFVLNA